MFNYGSPRVGNDQFNQKIDSLFNGKNFRLVHLADIVTHWPNSINHAGYHHIPRELWYN
jgi:hypothetical protein